LVSGIVVAAAFFGAVSSVQAANPSPVGLWQTVDDHTGSATGTIVEISASGDELVGRIVKMAAKPGRPADPLCTECQGDLHNAHAIGLSIIKGMKPDGDEWDGGTILDPDSGSTYSCSLRLTDKGTRLVVRGYIGISLFGRSQTWIRAE
jgi:uncharacterized protein (DUF2147 family)